VEASPHDAKTAYVVGAVRRDDHPYLFRTHDAGKTWTKIVKQFYPRIFRPRHCAKIPSEKGCCFAGTQSGAYVSFDDGDHWQPFQLNLPAAPLTDFAVHGDDLIAATFRTWIVDRGRYFSPARIERQGRGFTGTFLQAASSDASALGTTIMRTPLSPEFAASENPPDGAIFLLLAEK